MSLRRNLCVGSLIAVIAVPLFSQPRTVSRVAIVARPKSFSGPCPATLEFIGTIFVRHPARVTYEWERSDGARGARQTVDIQSAGQGVNDTWTLGRHGQRIVVWERLHVVAPTGIRSPAARVRVNCR